jgi:hypothetical protein
MRVLLPTMTMFVNQCIEVKLIRVLREECIHKKASPGLLGT